MDNKSNGATFHKNTYANMLCQATLCPPGLSTYGKYNCTLQHKMCQLLEKYMDCCALWG
ncbi:MAG: hypothetical protein LBD19_01485 [Endomicrobium sp.]|jgi:hypothetical protein|nr:hypothetical protein [Endomicrobium sp.]